MPHCTVPGIITVWPRSALLRVFCPPPPPRVPPLLPAQRLFRRASYIVVHAAWEEVTCARLGGRSVRAPLSASATCQCRHRQASNHARLCYTPGRARGSLLSCVLLLSTQQEGCCLTVTLLRAAYRRVSVTKRLRRRGFKSCQGSCRCQPRAQPVGNARLPSSRPARRMRWC